ncbi:MAG: DNA primase [Candidatus Omnitrophota bacterium]
MAGRFPEQILEQILDRIDIVELISGYIPLKKAGRNFKAACPFHYEKTPSFMVSPDKGIYHCFGCNAGGNAFNFLMRYEHLEFREAVEILAKKAQVVLPVLTFDETKISLEREIYHINELAAEFYQKNLLSESLGQPARIYLSKRKIAKETAKNLKLGFASDRWDSLLNFLRDNKINLKALEKSGLVITKEAGGFYDRFRNRIIFPIFDVKGRIIAFGGRLIEGSTDSAKYVNSPETAVFIKGNNLYGLNFAKEAIREKDLVILVEGYLDMITPYQAGIKNVVASSGTALTENQIRLLKRYTKNIVVVFDADSAGQIAALRSLDLFVQEDLYVKVVVLPEGFDPDAFIREKGAKEFNEIIKGALTLFDYKMSILLRKFDSKTIEGRANIAHEMISTVNKFKDEILKSEYMKKLAQALSISEAVLLREASQARERDGANRLNIGLNSSSSSKEPAVERMILKLILKDAGLLSLIKEEFEDCNFQDSQIRQIITTILELDKTGKSIEAKELMNFFLDTYSLQLISELAFEEDKDCIDGICFDDRKKMFKECLQRIKCEQIKSRKNLLHEQILAAQTRNDEEAVKQLIIEYNNLVKKKEKELSI